MKKISAPSVLLSPLALALMLPGWHASAAPTPEFKTGEVVVSGDRPGVERVTTVRTVTAEDIQRSGARTLDEALSLLPGVNVRIGGEGTPRIQVRGLQSRHIKLLIDGIPANSTFDGGFDPRFIPVDQIARIKLSAGSSSMLYGDGDLGGAINIITRKGAGDPHLGGAGVEGGEGGDKRGWASLSGANDSLDYYLGISGEDRNGYELPGDFDPTALEDGGRRDNSDRRRTHLYGNVGLGAGDSWLLGLTLRHSEGDFGVPPSTLDSTSDPFASRAKFERHDNQRADAIQISAEYAPLGAWSGRGWLYHNRETEDHNSYDDNSYSTVNDPALKTTFLLDNQTTINGAHAQVGYDAGGAGTVTVALDGRREAWQQGGLLHDQASGGAGGGGGGGGVFGVAAGADQRDARLQRLSPAPG